jgi:hypothetical protein
VPLIPIAAFLAGAILSLLLPVCLLIALAIWLTLAVRRVPGPGDAAPAREQTAAGSAEQPESQK